jgi:integrase
LRDEAAANPDVQDLLTIAHWTGWRKTSILTMEWSKVDMATGIVGLYARNTKNKKATRFPLFSIPELREIFERRRRQTDELEKTNVVPVEPSSADGSLQKAPQHQNRIPFVFHRDGVPVTWFNIRHPYEQARTRAGLQDYTIHDFRRTAVRRLANLGCDVSQIMDICGFKTVAMVRRYMGGTPDGNILEVGNKLAASRAAKNRTMAPNRS